MWDLCGKTVDSLTLMPFLTAATGTDELSLAN